MRDIYIRASRVVVWLGAETPRTEAACNAMSQLSREWLEKASAETVGYKDGTQLPDLAALDLSKRLQILNESSTDVNQSQLPNFSQSTWDSITDILRHQYFTREWVVQELGVARQISIQCGTQIISWDTIRGICGSLREGFGTQNARDASRNANNMVLLQDSLHYTMAMWEDFGYDVSDMKANQELKHLLAGSRHLHATDPRDKVYAFLGLCKVETYRVEHRADHPGDFWSSDLSARHMMALTPSYTVSVEELYSVVAKRLMRREGRLEILSYAAQAPPNGSLPSWVPDFRKEVQMIILGRIGHGFRPFHAMDGKNLTLVERPEWNKLDARGFCLDEIKELRDDLWLTDFWNTHGRSVSATGFSSFKIALDLFMLREYSTRSTYSFARHYYDRPKRYNY
jgi:hypothetical protein